MLLLLVSIVTPGVATAATIQTVSLGGGIYQAAGGSIGAAYVVGQAVARLNPWVNAFALGALVYKAIAEVPGSSGTVDLGVRASGQSEIVPAWGGTSPPATTSFVPRFKVLNMSAYSTYIFSDIPSAIQSYYDATYGAGTMVTSGFTSTNCTDAIGGTCTAYGDWRKSNGAGFTSISIYRPSSCPPGYASGGSVCNLSDSSQVPYPSDGSPTLLSKSDGSGFAWDTRDPDPHPPNIPSLGPLIIQSVCGGQPCQLTISSITGGGIKVETALQEQDTENNTRVYRQYIQTDSLGNVIDSGAITQPGTLTTAASTLPSTTSGLSAADSAALAQIAADQAAQKAAEDADRAEAEAEAAALPPLLSLASDVNTVDGLGLPTRDQFAEPDTAGIGDIMPSNDESCVTWPANLPYFTGLVLDPCPVVTAVRPIVNWMVVFLGVLAGIAVILGYKPEAS